MLQKILFGVFVNVLLSASAYKLDYLIGEVEYQCTQHCPLQNRTEYLDHYIEQCERGCKLWKEALNSSCQTVCYGATDRLTSKALYCAMGCNDALTKYFSQLKVHLGLPPAPALVADTLNSTSLKLEWNFPEARSAGLDCHVQWKYEEISANWQYSGNTTWNTENNIVFVEDLQPYTKYKFRIAIVLEHHGEPVMSSSSVVISTLPAGVPQSPPIIVRVAPVDFSSISVSWEPGLFPHGPLLSYVLQITDNNPSGHSEVKDIPPENTYTIVRTLLPSRNYTVTVSMRNNIGSGPPAIASVTTPAIPIAKNTEQPVLILGTENSVLQQVANIVDEPITIYRTKQQIKGIGLHISKKLLFISDSNSSILKLSLKPGTEDHKVILSQRQIDFHPLDLSVDWLNNQLYILGELRGHHQKKYIINRCTLDGENLTVAYAGLNIKPSTMEIDPYNGYLFWTIQDPIVGGMYRLDISDISNGIKYEVKVDRILNETNLGAFVVDHSNFRLLVTYEKQNTVYAVSLDGKEISNLRSKVTNSKLKKVISLATFDRLFYWTDGDGIYFEEFHHSFFHNSYPSLSSRHYKKVFINLPSLQPTPVPVNPPTNIQAIFTNNIAKTVWQPPHLLGVQGKEAWQNWSYEVLIKEAHLNSTNIKTYKNISTTSFTAKGLQDSTEYIIKVAAYTSSGKGPWSSEFRGMTLSRTIKPIILWSAAEGLIKSNAAGENVSTLIHKSQMKNIHFTNINWLKDQIYLVSNDSHVHWYNLTSHKQGRLMDLDSAGSIAVDWIGMKLYWSNPKQQLIMRANLNGTQQEPLPILTLAKELNIDSVKAYLYWSTGYAVECAHLNGADRMEYHHAQLFSGKQVMGLTLDIEQKYVYWIVRGSEGSNLFKSPMAGYGSANNLQVEKVATLSKPNMQGPLCYFHNRLLWLQDDKNAAICDLTGKNIATVNGKSIWGLNMVFVVDDSLHVLPDGRKSNELCVIPEAIDRNSVKVVGTSSSFNVTWKPVENVNYGTTFYEIQIESLSRNDSTVVTRYPSVQYWQQVTPFTKLHIAIRAFTYWGISPQTRVKIYSPPSTPSAPRNPRTYVTYDNKKTSNFVSITFRWDPPMFPNGVLKGYEINCWWLLPDDFNENEQISLYQDSLKTETTIEDLAPNITYNFQVKAYTEVGYGFLSEVISVNTSQELPLPTLLVAAGQSIFIEDIDANYNYSLVQGINPPEQLGYLVNENKVFWTNQLQELFVLNVDTHNKTKIADLVSETKGMTIDWLERSLYYVVHVADSLASRVYKINLNHWEKNMAGENMEILTTNSTITRIEVAPFTKKLYWVETIDGLNYTLMQSDTDGTDPMEFSHDLDDSCTSNITSTFTIDHSNTPTNPTLIFMDAHAKDLKAVDGNGCGVIADKTIVGTALPLNHIKSDFATLYWTNPYQGVLYAMNRREDIIFSSKEMQGVQDVLIFGKHMQPYPVRKCLAPKQDSNLTVGLIRRYSDGLELSMPEFVVDEECLSMSIATVLYTVLYREETNASCDFNTCQKISTFNKKIKIDELKPFTPYAISLVVTNHFSNLEEIATGSPVIFKTSPGAPSKPLNISALVLNPTLAEVHWLPPIELNGVVVHYEIHWQTETLSGVRQKGEQPVLNDLPQSKTSALLYKLTPNETYIIWVKAYSETNEAATDSDRIQITTFPEPSSLLLENKTAYNLKLSWKTSPNIIKYFIEYTAITSNEWQNVDDIERMDESIIVNVDYLKPKTQYKFRISLQYDENYPELFVWPSDSRFTYETCGDIPSPPGIPIIQYVKPNVYKVWWEASKDNGAPIEMYMLEGLQLPNYRSKRSTNRTAWFYTAPSVEEEEREWQTFYNGTNTSWIIDGLNEKYKYAFRVSALNSYGWGLPSKESTEFDFYEAARMAEKPDLTFILSFAIAVPLSIVGIICVICCVTKKYSERLKFKHVQPLPRRADVELATLRELPRRGVHSTNILYTSTLPTPEECLPHIRRDHITLTKFLGSGAFGEVFEGVAKGILGNDIKTKVAIKTLRKGASDQEKTEFLQEALLMSHFKHEHILQLLGVCLDNDPHFIIMELMQGGDLLTYLRSSRTTSSTTPALTLIELLKMCVDVSRGCRYLEEMHFVHRDLACRNCLVSSVESESRIVKIGDFGLARDIYKNDYYRKEGEGLLPVRWMSPESLVDGVFTSQSDVWAFGVLLWEIMTLGQQPYPARNNLEVLHYVRVGGRLGKPVDCPNDLHNLMLKCWEFVPDKRPTFQYCLNILQNLHSQKLRNPVTGAHEGQYISTVTEEFDGISNAIYFRDENHNSSGDTWRNYVGDETTNRERTPFLPEQNNPPKYLELVYDPESSLEANDGYEIPSVIISRKLSIGSTKSVSLPSDNLNRLHNDGNNGAVVKN